MTECEELIPLSSAYWPSIIEYSEGMDFKKCARLIGAARDDQLPKVKVNILDRLNSWKMLQWCFRAACFSGLGQPRSRWRENVAALGQVKEFDVQTMTLVLSFLDPNETPKKFYDDPESDYNDDDDSDSD